MLKIIKRRQKINFILEFVKQFKEIETIYSKYLKNTFILSQKKTQSKPYHREREDHKI